MTYRELTAADLPTIFAIRIEAWDETQEQIEQEMQELDITLESVAAMLEAGTHHGWVGECDERVIGFVMAVRETAEVWVIGVLRAYQGRGIGRQLMTLAEDWLRSCRHQEAWLHTFTVDDHPSVLFYRKLGWVDCSVDKVRKMKKSLPSQ
ncbi:MAG: GNAT family N-acetyltransferase [Verrucomicrobiota bacterium]